MLHFYSDFNIETESKPIPKPRGKVDTKIYLDLPYRYFADLDSLKSYLNAIEKMGINVLLILPHFQYSHSEYVVKDYQTPTQFFGTWEAFADFMKFLKDKKWDTMIDIPFNHCDKDVKGIKASLFKKDEEGEKKEAGAMDWDTEGNEIFIGWGAYVLDNSKAELIDFWVNKVIQPHVEQYHVDAVRIDAAWGLPDKGIKRLIANSKKLVPAPWFLAENLGMDQLYTLAKTAIKAGADRFFNNFFWYDGGLTIPKDMQKLQQKSGGLKTCTIWANHDVIKPAMKAFILLKAHEFEGKNMEYIVHHIVENWNIRSIKQLSDWEIKAILTVAKQEYFIEALVSTDIMLEAGAEQLLFMRTDVMRTGPEDFKKGIETDLPDFIGFVNQLKKTFQILHNEGTILPFGQWKLGTRGVKGYLKKWNNSLAIVAVNNDLYNDQSSYPLSFPTRITDYKKIKVIAGDKLLTFKTNQLPKQISLNPGDIFLAIAE